MNYLIKKFNIRKTNHIETTIKKYSLMKEGVILAEDLYVCDVDYYIFACQIQDYLEAEDEVLKN